MKKQTILGLAVCALSFGAVAGAISANLAGPKQVKATDNNAAIVIIDEIEWNFHTIHLYDISYQTGKSNTDLEDYLVTNYGAKADFGTYAKEGDSPAWTINQSGDPAAEVPGDYFITGTELTGGDRVGTKGRDFKITLPSYITTAKYQIINNSNWLNVDNAESVPTTDFYGAVYYDYVYDDGGAKVSHNTHVSPDIAISQWNYVGSNNGWSFEDTTTKFAKNESTYSLEVTLAAGTTFRLAANASWSLAMDSADIVAKMNDATKLVVDGSNVKVVAEGKYTFTIKDSLKGGDLGTQATVLDAITVSYTEATVDPVTIEQWYFVDKFINNWTAQDAQKLTHDTTNHVHSINLKVNKDDEFKLTSDGSWTYQIGTAIATKFNDSTKLEALEGGNILVKFDGELTISVADTVTDQILADSAQLLPLLNVSFAVEEIEDGYYLLGDHNSWAFGAGSKSTSPTSPNLAEWQDVELTAGQGFKVSSVTGNVKTWYGFNKTEEGCRGLVSNTDPADTGDIKIAADGTYDIYINESGNIWISKEGSETPSGHAVKIGDGANQNLQISSETGDFVAAYELKGVNLTAGQSIVFYDGETAITKIGGDTQDLMNANNMVKGGTDEAPTFTVQVTAENADIYLKKWNDGGYSFWITGRQSFYADVEGFVAAYITEQAKEAKEGDSCAAKYNAAKTALEALDPIAQEGFATHEDFAAAYASYTYWKDHKDAGSNVKNPGWPMGDRNATLLIAGSVFLIGAVIAGAMIYFSHKRKSEK